LGFGISFWKDDAPAATVYEYVRLLYPCSMPPNVPRNAKKVFDGILFDIYQWEQKRYDGTRSTYECAIRQDSVNVIAFTDKNTILLTEQEQPNRSKPFIDVPGGRVEKNETPEQTAKREFAEETGLRIGRLLRFRTVPLSGSTRFSLHFFLATDLTKEPRGKRPDPGEKIILRPTKMEKAVEMCFRGEMRQAWIMLFILGFAFDPAAQKTLRDFLDGKTGKKC
jgi:ADP-ribose pyrophosphatase